MKETKNIKKRPNVFTKIFAYTMLLLVLMSLAAAAIFARQFLAFYRSEQARQFTRTFQPLVGAFEGKGPEEIAGIARSFYDKNQSFDFIIQSSDGRVLFSTPEMQDMEPVPEGRMQRTEWSLEGLSPGQPPPSSSPPPRPAREGEPRFMIQMARGSGEWSYLLRGFAPQAIAINYRGLIGRGILALGIMTVIAVLGAVLFALRVTRPLEKELSRVRAMEENQRLFFSAASHELKTPIAAAEALVEGMIANIGDYRDHPRYLRECLKTLDSQARLVSEILEIVKLSEEDAEPVLVTLDLGELGNGTLEEYRPLAEQRGLSINGEFPGLPVRGDPKLLRRALSNVIANAVQNTPAGGSIRIETEKFEAKGKQGLRLSILNTGARIPEEALGRLFEPFYRTDPARTRNHVRTGLGLSIVKKALDRMKVPFGLENALEGVRFWMDLPGVSVP